MLTSLEELEAESLYILRETVEQFINPVILFSGGKDSVVLLHLARKALGRPDRSVPIPVLHIDTGHNFPELLEFRDRYLEGVGARLIVRHVEDSIRSGRVPPPPPEDPSRNRLQSVTLLDAISELDVDAAIGGGRRDEEKARAKERIFSHRRADGGWDPHLQRPELWQDYVASPEAGGHYRVFPLSNWTELDVWRYIESQRIEVPALYFTHPRDVVERDGVLLPLSPYLPLRPGEEPVERPVRFRTVGDLLCSGADPGTASTVSDIIQDILSSRRSERSGRTDDAGSESAMEERKREGYF